MDVKNESDKKTPSDLEEVREHYRTEAFRLMLYVLIIFGVPAIVAVVLGRWLDGVFESGKVTTVVLLVIAFIVSWVFMIVRYRTIDRKLKDVDRQLREEKK